MIMERFPLEWFCPIRGFNKYALPNGLLKGYSMYQIVFKGVMNSFLQERLHREFESPQ